MDRLKLNSQFLEYLALVGAGATALCFPAGTASGIAVSAAAGTAGLLGIGLAAHKKNKDQQLSDAISRITDQIAEEWRDGSNSRFARFIDRDVLNRAQESLVEHLPRCDMSFQTLAGYATDTSRQAFPSAATAALLKELNRVAPELFQEPPAPLEAGAKISREFVPWAFAKFVITVTFREAVENSSYFEAFEPHLLIEMARTDGEILATVQRIEESLNQLVEGFKTQVNRLEQLADQLEDQARNNRIVDALLARIGDEQSENEALRKQLEEAVAALSQQQSSGPVNNRIEKALGKLSEGNTEEARAWFVEEAKEREAEIQQGNRTVAEASQKASEAYRHQGALAFLNHTDEALMAYGRSTELDPTNPEGWNMLGLLLSRVGDLRQSGSAYQKVLMLTTGNKEWEAIAYGNLGIVHKTHGELDAAVEMYEKSLALNTELGRKEGMASNYGNLGIVHQTRGELDVAVEMYEKALALNTELGRKKGMANNYGNLGNVHRTRGELDAAVDMYEKSLVIETKLGRREGMAKAYGNLGTVYQTRGVLDAAVEMYEKSLALNTELGSKEGMANNYGNLGIVYQTRGELDAAVDMYEKSLVIETELGRKEGMAKAYGNLGTVHRTRGELDVAVEMYEKSLALNTELGSKEGVASNYGNLGNVHQTRGDLDAAVEMYEKSLALNTELGRKEGMANNYGNLGIVYQTRGELDAARRVWMLSLGYLEELGSPDAELVHAWLSGLEE